MATLPEVVTEIVNTIIDNVTGYINPERLRTVLIDLCNAVTGQTVSLGAFPNDAAALAYIASIGGTPTPGMLYFNTTSQIFRIYTTLGFTNYEVVTGALLRVNNLSEIATAGTTAQNAAVANIRAVPVNSFGKSNIRIGTGALVAPTNSAVASMAIGDLALASITDADSTIAFGYNAAGQMKTGRSSVFLGHVCGRDVLSGNSNTAVGGFAMLSTPDNRLTGSNNNAVGEAAMLNVEGAARFNNAYGFNALFGMRDAAFNCAYGNGAGLSITTNDGNTVIGNNVYLFGDGSYNVFNGASAGYGLRFLRSTSGAAPEGATVIPFADTSSMTVGMVVYAGANLKVGTKITAINPNVSITVDKPMFNPLGTTPIPFTFIVNQHTGTGCTITGYLAGSQISGPTNDVTAYGKYATRLATTATKYTAIGAYAAEQMLTSDGVTAIGYEAHRYQTGQRNTAVGADAMKGAGAFVGTGDDNTCIGYYAGLILAGSRNIFIGSSAGQAASAANDNIIIGNGINLSAPNVSGEMNIGNIFKATGMQTGATRRAYLVPANPATGSGEANVVRDNTTGELRIGGSGGSGSVGYPKYTWAGRPAASTTSGNIVHITNVGVDGGALFKSNGTDYTPVSDVVIARGTNTTSTATITIPALAWAQNGSLAVNGAWSFNASAAVKTLQCTVAGVPGTDSVILLNQSISNATFKTASSRGLLSNRGAYNSQFSMPINTLGGSSAGTIGAPVYTAIDTAQAVTVTFNQSSSDSGEPAPILEKYEVRLVA